jgi:hypothetical protein
MMGDTAKAQFCVTHAGAGELHLRPVLNLKTTEVFINLEI